MAETTTKSNASMNDFIVRQQQLVNSSDSELLIDIVNNLDRICDKNGGIIISQSSLKDLLDSEKATSDSIRRLGGSAYQNNAYSKSSKSADKLNQPSYRDRKTSRTYGYKRGQNIVDDMLDGLEDGFKKALFGSRNPIQSALNEPLRQFANKLGVSVSDLGPRIGDLVGQQIGRSFRNSAIGGRLTKEWESIGAYLANSGANLFKQAGDSLIDPDTLNIINEDGSVTKRSNVNVSDAVKSAQDIAKAADKFSQVAEGGEFSLDGLLKMGSDVIGGMGEAGAATSTELAAMGTEAAATGTEIAVMGEAAVGASLAFPEVTLLLIAGAIALDHFIDCFDPLVSSLSSFGKSLANAGDRVQTQNSKNLSLWRNRVEADVKSATTAAFDVIKDGAEKAMSAWDAVLTTVTATQGYDKSGLQELWSDYAYRLQKEGLDSVVSSADIMTNLKSVLESGLSGKAAEEFAYMATVLGEAIPTENFFNYADTYASLAANAIKQGADQEEALSYANSALESFASNLLYANRSVAGGLTTSLTNSADLFQKSAEITLASRTGDISDISQLLTSVSAVVGSIAPDLASGIVDAVTQAATGGNSANITALRSMAGVGASNTAFLAEIAKNPQKVFATLFENLAELQNMSADNYMEVAEGLSEVFGLSMDAFARVDFNYLADMIGNMDANNASLAENMKMLASGETKASAEQLRMQKINQYMIDEGLSYVLDNEVAREIQQHMWDEQLAREIEENTFAVDLQGSALELLNGLLDCSINILNFINPGSWVKKLGNVALTAVEAAAQMNDIGEILNKGNIGKGNGSVFKQLTTGNADLELTPRYIELMGGTSSVSKQLDRLDQWMAWTGQYSGQFSDSQGINELLSMINSDAGTSLNKQTAKASSTSSAWISGPSSYYTRRIISKGLAKATSGTRLTDAGGYNAIFETETGSGREYLPGGSVEETAEAMMKSLSDYQSSHRADDYSLFADKLSMQQDETTKLLTAANGQAYLTQSEILKAVKETQLDTEGSFEDWVAEFEKTNNISNLDAVLRDYGSDLNAFRAKYEEMQAKEASKESKARDLHEVQFWEDMQRFANDYFPDYLNEWKKYYIRHEAYTEATNNAYQEAINLANEEKDEQGDSVLALAKALTNNSNWLESLGDAIKDPTVQTNALLAQILVITEAIMQQNNQTSVVSVPTALSSLGLGITDR